MKKNIIQISLILAGFIFLDCQIFEPKERVRVVPAVPVLLSPVDDSASVPTNPILSWNPVDGEVSYRLQVSTDSVFETLVFDQGCISNVSWQLIGLSEETVYFWRVCASGVGGVSQWCRGWRFRTKRTLFAEPLTDIDGNVYRTVIIGGQVWMAENLKVTHFRNGEAIRHVEDADQWRQGFGAFYCDYDNLSVNADLYGHLYNWVAVHSGGSTVAPSGWHVPMKSEWQTLIDYLGGHLVAGGKLKEAGILHWESPNKEATNESGFSALPGGQRFGEWYEDDDWRIDFINIRKYARFWCDDTYERDNPYRLEIRSSDSRTAIGDASWRCGYSVRCIRD